MWKRCGLLAMLAAAVLAQQGCAALAGGAVGAAIGHEAAEREAEEEAED